MSRQVLILRIEACSQSHKATSPARSRHHSALKYLKLGDGPYYVLAQNYHLCHLEIPITIRRILNGGSPLLTNSPMPTASVAAIAKRRLVPGERIRRGIGSFAMRGIAISLPII